MNHELKRICAARFDCRRTGCGAEPGQRSRLCPARAERQRVGQRLRRQRRRRGGRQHDLLQSGRTDPAARDAGGGGRCRRSMCTPSSAGPAATRSPSRGAPVRCGTNDGGNAGGWAFVPSLYFSAPIGDRWAVGLGVGAPFGLKTEYESNWLGRFQGIKSELTTINVNPSRRLQGERQDLARRRRQLAEGGRHADQRGASSAPAD